ncbi:MAG TPA: hypothetical protein VGE31_00970 [Candidatus Paceibacterota bacterium]
MDILIILLSILQLFSISLGVGASTLAIVSFLVALADGNMEPGERRMLGVIFKVLRVAMVAILVTTLGLMLLGMEVTSFVMAQLIVIAMLYVNAILMTKHIMPKTLGPAVQAGTWYTLGTLTALVPLDLTNFGLVTFILIYIAILVLAIAIVNGLMGALKKKTPAPAQPAK